MGSNSYWANQVFTQDLTFDLFQGSLNSQMAHEVTESFSDSVKKSCTTWKNKRGLRNSRRVLQGIPCDMNTLGESAVGNSYYMAIPVLAVKGAVLSRDVKRSKSSNFQPKRTSQSSCWLSDGKDSLAQPIKPTYHSAYLLHEYQCLFGKAEH